jgi:hypothetical protein
MQLSSRQRAMAAVLGVFGLALFADRLFILPGSGAAAPVASSESLLVSPHETVTTTDLVLPTPESTLAQQLCELADDRLLDATRVPDAFLAPVGWLPVESGPIAAAHEGSADAARFAARHTLTAVLVAGPRSHAVLDGEILLIGHSVEGFRLVDVRTRSAEFRSDHETVTLRLADPGS